MKHEPKFKCWAYHWTVPEGKIFEDREEYEQAIENGWVKAPWLAVKPKEDKPQKDKKLCECGCGEEVNPGKRFVSGHYFKWAAKNKQNGG